MSYTTLELHLSDDEQRLLADAAKASGLSLNQFVLVAAVVRAQTRGVL